MNNFTGEVPSMPSGDGKPLKPLTCACRDCDFKGGLLESVKHYQTLHHRITYKGILQDFSHIQQIA
jgi:hypothetical protein